MSPRRLALVAVVVFAAVPVGRADWFFFGSKEKEKEPPAPTVRWFEDPEQAFEAVGRSGRPLLVYITAEKCGFCRKMESETWADPAVAKLVSARFVPLKLHAETHAEEVAALGVRAYPTTVVVSPQGKPLAGRVGFLAPEKLADLLALKPAAVAALPATGDDASSR